METVIGVVGGSGLYEIPGLSAIEQYKVETPFGVPSDDYIIGRLGDKTLVFLPRHGRGHRIPPTSINYRANIYGFKKLGVEWLISVSAVGSMRETIAPGHMVVVDQFIDQTKQRASSFYGEGLVGHVPFADPVCSALSGWLASGAERAGAIVHRGGTYLCIEGPQFSTKAESQLYRQWGADVIGMTNLPEAKLAREAGLCYASLAMATDYDCWHTDHDAVTVESVLEVVHRNVDIARKTIVHTVELVAKEARCAYRGIGRTAQMTSPQAVDPELAQKLAILWDDI